MGNEVEDGFTSTAKHAAMLWAKGELLKAQAREALLVALDLMPAVSSDAVQEAYDLLKAAGVSGRRGLLDELGRRGQRRRDCPPGTTIRRARGTSTPWPKAPAWVYVLIADTGRTLYVGKSKEPRGRMSNHNARGVPWVEVELIACASERDALSLEGDLIYQHQPPWNIADVRTRRKVS